ncbi:MAG: histidine phosphatase family protein [Thermodesulfobacteriota bacterium]
MATYPPGWLAAPGRLLLMRHGRLAEGDGRRYLGQGDPPLAPEGEAQMRAWRPILASLPLAFVQASDLARARQSAAIATQGAGLAVETDPAWREIDLGDWEGRAMDEVARLWPESHAARGADPAGFRPPGGESFADLLARVWPAFMALAARPGPGLVVTHAGVLRVLVCRLLGAPLSQVFAFNPHPAGLCLVDCAGQLPRLAALNLPPLLDSGINPA